MDLCQDKGPDMKFSIEKRGASSAGMAKTGRIIIPDSFRETQILPAQSWKFPLNSY
jgi:hypothetical protein